MNNRKTRAAYRINQRNISGEYTRPEIIFDSLFKHRVTKPLPIEVFDVSKGIGGALFRPDRQFIGTKVLVHIQGKYHRTEIQRKHTQWQFSLLQSAGYRNLAIDADLLMTKKYHQYVIDCTEKFLTSTKEWEYLYA